MSKLTEKRVKIQIKETTKLSQILYWLFFAICIITPLLHHFLQTSNYINIGWVVCLLAHALSVWNDKSDSSTSPLGFGQTLYVINKSIRDNN